MGGVDRCADHRAREYRYADPFARADHRVTILLTDEASGTRVSLTEDGHATERAHAHAEGGWRLALNNLRAVLEAGA